MKWIRRVTLAAAGLLGLALLAGWLVLRGSLPMLDGEVRLQGLEAAVTIERDEVGIPTIRGESRLDLARATGFVHGQDRFFQMDLRRRFAAGELAALFGAAAVEADRRARLHRFRARAREAMGTVSEADRSLLDAYAAGANAGLASLRVRPFEYLALRSRPEPWEPEDCLLAAWSMFLDLQPETGRRERAWEAMRRALSPELYRFLTDNGSAWEATLDGTTRPIRAVPAPEHFAFLQAAGPDVGGGVGPEPASSLFDGREPGVSLGSNNWAVSGALMAGGEAAGVANDMHLSLRDLPPVWYRARFVRESGGERTLDVNGVTFAGVPLMVAGSNGCIAWGFTNANADVSDVVLVEPVGSPDFYQTPDGPRALSKRTEMVRVRGGEPRRVVVEETIWGPVRSKLTRKDGRREALAWVAHDTSLVNMHARRLESARSVEEALEAVRGAWFPVQNMVVGDRAGNIAWTVVGPVPRRIGFDGTLPISMADARARWAGVLEPAPAIMNPPEGRLWTANARVVGGAPGEALGDGGFKADGRAFQIGARLSSAESFDVPSLFSLQLDCETFFLRRWRDLMLELLDRRVAGGMAQRARLREELEAWEGAAVVDSVAHGKIHAFRELVAARVFARVLEPARAGGVEVRHEDFNHEEPLWLLVSGRHPWTTRATGGWDEELVSALDVVAGDDRTWGERNRIDMCHPLARFLPILRTWLAVERTPASGDKFAPNALFRGHGPSERFVVAPGREGEGVMHMPGGQSGHPLSPYFRAGHNAWIQGRATSFLPGEPEHRMRLVP